MSVWYKTDSDELILIDLSGWRITSKYAQVWFSYIRPAPEKYGWIYIGEL